MRLNQAHLARVQAAMLDLKLIVPLLVVLTAASIVAAMRSADDPDAFRVSTSPAPAPAPSAVSPSETDEAIVAWDTRVLSATGSAHADVSGTTVAKVRAQAERGAKLAALRKLVRGIGALRTSTGATVADVVDEATIQQAAQTYRVADTKYYSDGGVEIVATIPLELIDSLVAPSKVVGP